MDSAGELPINSLVKDITSREEPFGEWSLEESPHLKAGLAAAHIHVSGDEGIDDLPGLVHGSRSGVEETKVFVEHRHVEAFHTPGGEIPVKSRWHLSTRLK